MLGVIQGGHGKVKVNGNVGQCKVVAEDIVQKITKFGNNSRYPLYTIHAQTQINAKVVTSYRTTSSACFA